MAKTRGAIGFCLDFFCFFFGSSQKRKIQKPQAVRKEGKGHTVAPKARANHIKQKLP